MKNLVIIGAGDLGKEIVWLIEDINRIQPTYLILGFLDDDLGKDTYSFCGYRVLGGTDDLEALNNKIPFSSVLAIKNGHARKKIVEKHPDYTTWETIIHPSSVIAPSAKIERGCVFFPQVTVSVNSYLGQFCLLHIHSTICNECWIGNYVSIMANSIIYEHNEVKAESFVGPQSCIDQRH